MVLIPLPALERRAANAEEARPVALEIPQERRVQESFGRFTRNGCVPEVETVLPVYVRQVDIMEQPALLIHFAIERRTRNRRVQHELVKVGFVRNGSLDLLDDVFGRVVFQPQNSGP